MSSASKRRCLAKDYVQNGLIKGYLAYIGNRAVGWCNANDKNSCQNCISWMRNLSDVDTSQPSGPRVKSVFCFAIAMDHRRKGVATELLKRVCIDAKNEGYEIVEAYPKKTLKNLDDFEGPLSMYLKQGFVITRDCGDYFVVEKHL